MAMTLDQLKRSRTTRKTIIKKLMAEMQIAVDAKKVPETERCLAQLELKEANLHNIALQLEQATLDDSELDLAIQENEAFSEIIIDAKILAHRMLAAAKIPINPLMATSSSTSSITSKVVTKLPKLQIRKFDGALSDWERFWDQFKSGVDDNTSLSKVDKFNYLKSFLSDNASLTIAGLSLTAANYDIATNLLLKKYGKPDVLIAEHVRQLLEVKKIPRVDNGLDLRLLLENFQTHVRALDNLGKNVDSMGTLLCPTLLKALPYAMIREWHRQTAGQANDNLKLLLDFIQTEIEGVELASRNSASSTQSKDVKKSVKTDNLVTSASTLVATGTNTSNTNAPRSKLPCLFCSSSQHFTVRCPEFQTREERSSILRNQGRGFRFLKQNHTIQFCDSNYKCFKCQQPHHSLLCNKNKQNKPESARQTEGKQRETTFPKTVAHTSSSEVEITETLVASTSRKQDSKNLSVLQTLRVWIKHKEGRTQAVLLLDGGSERSFINQEFSRKLQLPVIGSETLTVHAFGGKNTTRSSHRVAVSLVGHNENCLDISLLEVPEISTGVKLWETSQIDTYLSTHNVRYNWRQAMGDGKRVKVDILIGADLYWRLVNGHMKRLSSSLMAIETIFGWTLQGAVNSLDASKHVITMFSQSESVKDDFFNDQITQLWELDKTGIISKEEQCPRTLQELEVLEQFKETTVLINSRYEVRIPWNQDKLALCNNYALAKQRLKGLLLQLQKKPDLLERYRAGIYEYLNNHHTELVESDDSQEPIFYLPHHPIIKEERKTTKLRIVFDGSAHDSTGKSLNQCQFTGPNLNPTIFALLLRFRSHRIAISSDVEKAFLQVGLSPEDRNATRFLWTDSEWTKDEEPPLVTFRMARVLFGMKSSPFLLAATIRHHLAQYLQEFPIVCPLLDNNTYVDDFLSGADNTENAFFISTQAKTLMDKASLPLKKWATNDKHLRQMWIEIGLVSEEEPVELLKILGLMWNPLSDCLFFKVANLKTALETSQLTKRSVLEILARVFDPLGFLSPKLITLKILLQELWRSKVSWDELLQEPFKSVWDTWKTDIKLLEEFQVQRWYGTIELTALTTQLHIFCDASMRAYGAVAFLRICLDNNISTAFVCSKTRVAPLKLISIPRLELLACVIGARLANSLLQAWNSNMSVTLWTDSQVALQWVKSVPSKWKVFVARRIQEIQDLTEFNSWKYCPTKDNPADILSRGMNLKLLLKSSLWWNGPKWLSQEELCTFDPSPGKGSDPCLVQEEESHSFLVTTEQRQEIFDPQHFSTWRKIIRITAWMIKFLQNCRKKTGKPKTFLTIQELKNAESYWFGQIQSKLFPHELHLLKSDLKIPTTSQLFAFQPFLDRAGTLRMTGRLQFANIPTTQAHPVLLKGGGIIDLFILDRHERTLHGGVQTTLQKIREDVWLLRGRQTVRSALKKCLVCRKWSAKPVAVVEAPLPAARITCSLAFEVTGLDFAGPVWVKVDADKEKAYICLFTCAVTRNVHLELTLSQNIKHFLWALRRFTARRGGCKVIYSDNAATFAQADRLLQEALQGCQHTVLQDWSVQQGIEWRFIPPRACWWGGFYERLVGSIKRHLRRTLGATLMVPDEFATLLTEIEAVINSRPLLTLSEDSEDREPLTPAHFLIGKKGGPLVDFLPALNTAPIKPALLRKWYYRKRLLDNYWKQWSKEYLLQLRSAHELNVPLQQVQLKLKDVVLIRESRLPRGQWKMAVIEEMYEGRDGKIRSLLLRTSAGTPLRRAVQDVCALEIA